ncbi:hypothetical protein [Paraburkholderia heleia]|uniref:hypothetical protein n=1 Tax=Paraburkholderia heleia TaxID=634127 RepID=UPI002AB78FD2|nr:hypothetical protein [Paraburkholderia heleia]
MTYSFPHEATATRRVTLPDQVSAEARRRGGVWTGLSDECARKAQTWFGHRPCRREDLRSVFDEIFRTK